MGSNHRPSWKWCLLLVLLSSCTGCLQARSLLEDTAQPAAAAPTAASPSSSSGNGTSPAAAPKEAAVDVGSAFNNLLKNQFKNMNFSALPIKEMLMAHKNHTKQNFTMPKLEDFVPKNFSVKAAVQGLVNNITNGMTAMEFAKALMTGTISSNTADTNTPDIGLSDVQSGAININPFVDGAALSNALTLAGRDATANSKGMVFGMVGTGRSSSQATALGMTNAKSSTDTITINGGGFSQNSMGSNLAATPMGRADTSIRSAAFNIIGNTATGGLTTAFGKKGAASAGLGAGMTGLGESYSSQFADSISAGDTNSNVGVIAGTLAGAAKSTVGSVSVSSKKSAQSQSLSTSKSALGSATSKSASLSTAAQNATSHVSSRASTGVGNVDAISSTTSTGMNAKSSADSTSTSQAGAANSRSHSKSLGVTSAEASSTASSHPFVSGIRDTPILWTQRKRPSTTWTTSRSSSSTARVAAASSPSAWGSLSRFVPAFLQHTGSHSSSGRATTAPLLTEALVSSAALKALLPAVPKIHPQLPTFNQSIVINNTAEACNETTINANRTADMPRLLCNATNNGTNITLPTKVDPSGLPGIGFFKNLQDMNTKFMSDTQDSKNKSHVAKAGLMASQMPSGAKSSKTAASDPFAAWTRSNQGVLGDQRPRNKAAVMATGPKKATSSAPQATKKWFAAPIGPQKPSSIQASSSSDGSSGSTGGTTSSGSSSSSSSSSGDGAGQVPSQAASQKKWQGPQRRPEPKGDEGEQQLPVTESQQQRH